MDHSSSDHQITYNYSIDPFEIDLPPSERRYIARQTKNEIDRAFASRNLDFSESIFSHNAVELYANPQLPPSWEFGALVQTAYDRAIVEMQRDFVDGEYHFIGANIQLYGERLPLAYASTLHILSDESTTTATMDTENPDFYLEIPDLERGQPDIIPLDYARLKIVLDGLVAQSNTYEAITNDNRTIEDSLFAILEMSGNRSIKRESRYKFSDMAAIGHAIVSIAQQYHFTAGVAAPTNHRHDISVDNILYLDSDNSTATATYAVENRDGIMSARTGIAYERMFIDDQHVESFEQTVYRSAKKWRQDIEANSKKHHVRRKVAKFGSYIAMGLSRMNNVSDDPTSEQLS